MPRCVKPATVAPLRSASIGRHFQGRRRPGEHGEGTLGRPPNSDPDYGTQPDDQRGAASGGQPHWGNDNDPTTQEFWLALDSKPEDEKRSPG